MDNWQLFLQVSGRFAGFSLEKRQEWEHCWRLRVLPNKQERQPYRTEVYGDTAEEAIRFALDELQRIDQEVNS